MLKLYGIVSDRPATSRAHLNAISNKIQAEVAAQPHDPEFWQPVRESMLMSIGPSQRPKDRLVVTYVSRQHAPKGRRLDPAANARLEKALKALEPQMEVNIVYFEDFTPVEQIRIAGRSDVSAGPEFGISGLR